MRSKFFRVLLSCALCFSLLSSAAITAWAEEGLKDSGSFQQDLDTSSNNASNSENALEDGSGNLGNSNSKDTESLSAEEQTESGTGSDSATGITPLATPYKIKYQTHVQNIGWQPWVDNGRTAGTLGRSLRVEALQVKLEGSGLSGSVQYRSFVQNDKDWQPWVTDGKQSGTINKALRIEAIALNLTGDLAKTYDIAYRVHVQNVGWMAWTANGKETGTYGYGYRIEAIEIKLVAAGTAAVSSAAFQKKPMAIEGRAHVQNVGWMGWAENGATIGTTGRGLRVEALNLKVTNSDYAGSIEYRAHVQNVGWQPWVKDGNIAGVTGKSLRVEAIQVKLTGELAEKFDVYYRVHAANIGWLGWATEGNTAGAVGHSCKLESLQVRLVQKGNPAPGSTNLEVLSLSIAGQAKISGTKEWLSEKSGKSVTFGTAGQSKKMEACKLSIQESNISGSIEYSTHVSNIGWQSWTKAGNEAGTIDQGRQIEAIRIKLTGSLSSYFDIYYRAYIDSYGWLGWTQNGSNAGTSKLGLPMEAFQVIIVAKGAPAPGSTARAFMEYTPLPASYSAMNDRVAGLSSPTGWVIAIDTKNCLVGVYSGSKGNWKNVYMWPCAPGKASTPTIKGTFSVGSRGYVFGSGYSCYYWTQFKGNYLFHSVLYYQGTNRIKDGTMGQPASHGCVRLDIQNAKWIHDNIPSRTTVISY